MVLERRLGEGETITLLSFPHEQGAGNYTCLLYKNTALSEAHISCPGGLPDYIGRITK